MYQNQRWCRSDALSVLFIFVCSACSQSCVGLWRAPGFVPWLPLACFPHKCHIGCERFSLSRFWRCTRIDVLSQTSGLPNSPRVSPMSPLKCPSGDIRAENRYLLNFSPHRFIWQKLKHDLWLLEGGMSMIFADLYAPFVTPFAFWICIVPSVLRY